MQNIYNTSEKDTSRTLRKYIAGKLYRIFNQARKIGSFVKDRVLRDNSEELLRQEQSFL